MRRLVFRLIKRTAHGSWLMAHMSYELRAMSLFIIGIFLFTLLPSENAWAKRKKGVSPKGCRAVILSDSTRGKRLYEKNSDTPVLPASTTKIMTAILVMERLSLNDYVTVSSRAVGVAPSKISARVGERYKVSDLLYALLLNSANDASVVLAEAVAGSEYRFVQMMNQRAAALGARRTKFANSNGLPTRAGTQYTTAYDMYVIFRRAMQFPFFRQAIHLRYKNIASSDGRRIMLKSHNKILFKNWRTKVYGKTGYTRAAGTCFVGTLSQGDRTLIIGVFDCHDRWEEIKRVVTRYGGARL